MYHNLNCKLTTKHKFEEIYTNPQNTIKERYIYTMILSAIGDTLGFGNGEIEFNLGEKKFTTDITLDLFYKFLESGGVSGIDLKNKIVSDDTVFHMGTAYGLIKSSNLNEELYKNIVKEYIKELNEPDMEKRKIGVTTKESLERIRDGRKYNDIQYNEWGGGNGAAMRMMCVGLALHKKDDLDKLIESSTIISKMTHNNPIGYLGGIISAYITSLAIRQVNIFQWVDHIIGLLSGNKIDDYIKKTTPTNEYNKYITEKIKYLETWKIYKEILFGHKVSEIGIKLRKIDYHLPTRIGFYKKRFNILKNNQTVLPGSDGLDCLIIAYDCLIDCKENWELLIYFGMINAGDSDTIGAIAAAWYGAYYGRPKNLLKNQWVGLEFLDELYDIGEKLYNKFNK